MLLTTGAASSISVVPRHDSGEHHGYRDVEHGADNQRGDDADGNVALRILGLFRCGGDRVKSDVGEENDGAAGEHAGPALGHEGMIVRRMNKAHAHEDEGQDGGDLQQDHDVVGLRRLANAAHQDDRQQQHDEKRGNVEAEVPTRRIQRVVLQIGEAAGQIGGRDPAQRGMPAKPVERRGHVRRKTDANGHVADCVFQDQVPADDPRDQLAHGGVGVGVGAAGDGDHRGQLGIAQPGERADDRHQDQRKRQRRTCAGAPKRRRVMHDVIRQRAVEDGGGVEFLSGDGRAHDGEDAGANDRADAEPGQRPRA